MEEFKKMWKYGFTFSGRSTRRDFWVAILFNMLVSILVSIVAGILRIPSLSLLYSVAVLVPNWALSIRRMHDINKSGWCLLLGLIPLAGPIFILIFYCLPSVNEGNTYGEILE